MHQFPITGVAFLLILGDKMNCEVGFAICFLRAYTCHAAQFPESMYVPALLPCYLIVGLLTPMGLRARLPLHAGHPQQPLLFPPRSICKLLDAFFRLILPIASSVPKCVARIGWQVLHLLLSCSFMCSVRRGSVCTIDTWTVLECEQLSERPNNPFFRVLP